jgi:hypothetical protein
MLSIWQSFSLDCKKLKVARAYRPIFRRQALKPEVKALSLMIPLSARQWDVMGVRDAPSNAGAALLDSDQRFGGADRDFGAVARAHAVATPNPSRVVA